MRRNLMQIKILYYEVYLPLHLYFVISGGESSHSKILIVSLFYIILSPFVNALLNNEYEI